MGFGIKPLNIRRKDDCIQYFTSERKPASIHFASRLCAEPTELFADPEIVAKYGHYPQLLEVVQSAVLRPPIAQYAQASDILQLPQCCAHKSAQS